MPVSTFHRRAPAAALVPLFCSAGAAAGPPTTPEIPDGDTLRPYVYAGSLYDSNLFRVSGDDEARSRIGSTDTDDVVSRAGTGLRAELPISLQTVRFDGWVERVHFDTFDELDHTAADAEAAWDWEIGRLWSGTLDAGYQRGISRFEELQQLRRNIKTGRSASFDAGFRFLPDWEAVAGAGWREIDHDERDFLDREERSTFAELRYYTPVGTRVGLRATVTEGDFDRRESLPDGALVSNDYTETSYHAVVGWEGSAKSYLEARAGYTRREHDERTERDFDGLTARLGWRWQATAKTSLRLSLWRELQFLNDEVATYVESRGVGLEPVWDVTPKISLRGVLTLRTQDFAGAEGTSAANAGREDDVYSAGLGLDYEVLRNLRLTVEATVEERDSNQEDKDYEYEQVFAGAAYAF